ncbi:hypothetical protein BD289DRAFT_185453 [Coniella lustricola]|uniref:Uncharacterized protein n=1 Tax=Coniella lustricola TaxID=2025994 RepID=A0A2T2ZT37_9PEZI|nr:hypothetical protein BD289DRAFT_185453 [Coniella lustricola]
MAEPTFTRNYAKLSAERVEGASDGSRRRGSSKNNGQAPCQAQKGFVWGPLALRFSLATAGQRLVVEKRQRPYEFPESLYLVTRFSTCIHLGMFTRSGPCQGRNRSQSGNLGKPDIASAVLANTILTICLLFIFVSKHIDLVPVLSRSHQPSKSKPRGVACNPSRVFA